MRISDWSSDVCSSDLGLVHHRAVRLQRVAGVEGTGLHGVDMQVHRQFGQRIVGAFLHADGAEHGTGHRHVAGAGRRHDLQRLALEVLHRLGVEAGLGDKLRSEEHTSELQSLMRISYAVFCLKKKKTYKTKN